MLRSLGANSNDPQSITIPGTDCPAKTILEQELAALASRVQQLEARAAATTKALPDTPSDFQPASPFALPLSGANRLPLPGLELGPDAIDLDREAQLEFLQAKLKFHEEEIQENRKKLRVLMQETEKVRNVPQVPANEASKIDRLQRELKKSQQANEAFSKALREIGEIVTAGTFCVFVLPRLTRRLM